MEKCGFFLCTGCGIADVADADELVKVAKKDGKAVAAKTHEQLCNSEGVKLITETIAAEGLDSIVIGACSSREFAETFTFPEVVVERAALREHVAWVCKGDDEDKQFLAEDYVRMYCVKVQKSSKPERLTTEVERAVLVVGGGVTGMNAALEAARAGYKAVLVEKADSLGGMMLGFKKRFPRGGTFAETEDNDIDKMVAEVESTEGIDVNKSTEIESISGAPGGYEVKLRGGSTNTVNVGAIVVAVGGTPYDPTKLSHLGYGASKNVVTNVELERMAKEGKLVRPSDGKPIESVMFVQCAGSRDPDHLPYCSNTCCPTSVKQAGYIRELVPKARTYVLYKDMRLPGLMENYYRQAQKDGVIFIKGEVGKVDAGNGMVKVEASDQLSGDDLEVEVDLLVLATGIEPNTKGAEGAGLTDEATEGATEEKKEGDDEDKAPPDPELVGQAEVLNLTYRLSKELPIRKYGFPNSHFICFPYETRRTGIYAAGTVRQPVESATAMADGAGAALKAIQCVEASARGEAVHPRASDITYPDFFLQRCTQCKRCTEECPFGTLDEDEKGTPKPNPSRCRRCGVCMGACPERIISFANYSVDTVGSMLKSMSIPDEFEEKPRILCLVCENDTLPALDMAAQKRMELSPWVRIIPVRCLGSMNLQWVNDSLIKGIDGVMLIGCKYGDDYQCHFIKGSELCNIRLSKVQETLTRLMLEPERVRMEQFELGDWAKLPGIINAFAEEMEALDPNPNKGF